MGLVDWPVRPVDAVRHCSADYGYAAIAAFYMNSEHGGTLRQSRHLWSKWKVSKNSWSIQLQEVGSYLEKDRRFIQVKI